MGLLLYLHRQIVYCKAFTDSESPTVSDLHLHPIPPPFHTVVPPQINLRAVDSLHKRPQLGDVVVIHPYAPLIL